MQVGLSAIPAVPLSTPDGDMAGSACHCCGIRGYNVEQLFNIQARDCWLSCEGAVGSQPKDNSNNDGTEATARQRERQKEREEERKKPIRNAKISDNVTAVGVAQLRD